MMLKSEITYRQVVSEDDKGNPIVSYVLDHSIPEEIGFGAAVLHNANPLAGRSTVILGDNADLAAYVGEAVKATVVYFATTYAHTGSFLSVPSGENRKMMTDAREARRERLAAYKKEQEEARELQANYRSGNNNSGNVIDVRSGRGLGAMNRAA